MPEITDLTLSQIIESLRAGALSSQEVTRAYLQRIERLEPFLHTFITLTPQLAITQAEAADRSLAAWRGDPSQPISP